MFLIKQQRERTHLCKGLNQTKHTLLSSEQKKNKQFNNHQLWFNFNFELFFVHIILRLDYKKDKYALIASVPKIWLFEVNLFSVIFFFCWTLRWVWCTRLPAQLFASQRGSFHLSISWLREREFINRNVLWK